MSYANIVLNNNSERYLYNENFAIAVFHFCIVTDSQKWTAVAWEPYIALKCEWLLNN